MHLITTIKLSKSHSVFFLKCTIKLNANSMLGCECFEIKFYTADWLPCFGCENDHKFKLGRMYQTAHQNDGFNALRLCCSKLNPACLCYDSKPAKLQGMMSDATSQSSSRTAKSGKFTFLSRAIKRSDIHLEVLSSQNRKLFPLFSPNFGHLI